MGRFALLDLALNEGWIKAARGDEALELIKANPLAFTLASVIAHRAKWFDGFNHQNLQLGQALLGDFKNYGMTEQQYRTAKLLLMNGGFATFKSTPKGTVASLVDTRLYDIGVVTSNGQINGQPTDSQRTANGQPTTPSEVEANPSPSLPLPLPLSSPPHPPICTPSLTPLSPTPQEGKKERRSASPPLLSDEDWLKELAEKSCYQGINVQQEYGKMACWCEQKRKLPSRARFLNWLNRCDKPMQLQLNRAVVPDHSKGF